MYKRQGVDTATQMRLAHPWVLYLMPVGGLAIVGLYRLTKTEGKGTCLLYTSRCV